MDAATQCNAMGRPGGPVSAQHVHDPQTKVVMGCFVVSIDPSANPPQTIACRQIVGGVRQCPLRPPRQCPPDWNAGRQFRGHAPLRQQRAWPRRRAILSLRPRCGGVTWPLWALCGRLSRAAPLGQLRRSDTRAPSSHAPPVTRRRRCSRGADRSGSARLSTPSAEAVTWRSPVHSTKGWWLAEAVTTGGAIDRR